VSEQELLCELPGGGRALFTSRADGNVSSVTGAQSELGELVRERLRERIGVRRIARGRQVHGTIVSRVIDDDADDAAGAALLEADGHATASAEVGVMVLTADCLPVAVGCSSAVAMLHAGWRGLAAGVLEQGVQTLEELGCSGRMTAVIGPGAGACCYEVGPEVHAALGLESQRGTFDLRGLARGRLVAAGVTGVRDIDACTICDERYFSHRREGARAGRQAGVAWLG
jgi:purine-nucleoside/S-methyl-5'-thioadenosine phosphorylase / adenosine deaminase